MAAYLRAAERAKESAVARKAASARLKLAMGDHDRARIAGASVTYRTVESSRIDARRLRRDHPRLAAEYTTTTTSPRLTVRGPR